MRRYLTIIFTLISAVTICAQEKERVHNWEYEIRAGVAIGGTSPLPLPREIRKIVSYSPGFSPLIEALVTRRIDKESRWSITSGIRAERKYMSTEAKVKNYRTEIIGENDSKLRGNWTGEVNTDVDNWYISLPILCRYDINDKVAIKGGVFFSYLLDGSFSGSVSNGYLRKENPTGDKIIFDSGTKGVYDFSNNMNNFSWGIQAGADWHIMEHVKLYTQLTWGINEIFESDFNTISFSLYPIYLNIGAGYCF